MTRRLLMLTAAATMLLVAGLAVRTQPQGNHPLLDRALKAQDPAPPVAVLIEMGVNDVRATDWSGRATVTGAKVVQREGYRFWSQDQLVEPDGWKASSHRSIRAPAKNPAVAKLAPIASVGVVLYLTDITDEAKLTLETAAEGTGKVTLALDKVLAGEKVTAWDGAVVLRRISTAEAVSAGRTEDDCPAAAHAPDGTLWVAYTAYTLRDENRRIEADPYKQQPADFRHLYKPGYAETVMLRSYANGKWGQPIAVTGDQEDVGRLAVAVGGDGKVWVIWSAHVEDRFDLYAVPLDGNKPGPRVQLTRHGVRNLTPAACTDSQGNIWVAYQSWKPGAPAQIHVVRCKEGKWSEPQPVPVLEGDGNCWHPAIAAGPDGKVCVAYDVYRHGSYDIRICLVSPGGQPVTITATDLFEARPSITYDRNGRLWIAYEQGPSKWGKDYGALDSKDGNPLYNTRTVRVCCWHEGLLFQPKEQPAPNLDPGKPELPFDQFKTNQFERRPRFAYPVIGIDGKGRVWVAYRRNFGSRYSSHPGAYWVTFARRLNGDHWTPEMEVHHSDGLLDHRPVVLPHASGGLLVVHNTDGRYTTPEKIQNCIFASVIGLRGEARDFAPQLVKAGFHPFKPGPEVRAEREAVQRMRQARIKAAGKELLLLRGEYHRHTEISWDGGPDGSLEDMFRYAIDAASMDWIGNGDHDNGAGREYSWHLVQKWSDAYHVRGAFTPMFTYERSVAYPHGHRNVMFAKRGVLTLPRLAAPAGQKAEGGVHPDDTKMLYRYLKEHDGICAVHTSATSMGTDWRDNDPQVEPIVEIYQGDRMSYEHEGAPRAGYDPKSGKEPANVAGWYPKGFINLALQRGYKLGFQASSDHWSTHISYFIILAEKNDRDSILKAVKQRHCYGATDNILLDVRCGQAIMGDEVELAAAPTFSIQVSGTSKLAKIDILRDSQVVATLAPQGSEFRGTWTDPQPQSGTHYYYVRVLQTDDEIAWGSPIWVTRK